MKTVVPYIFSPLKKDTVSNPEPQTTSKFTRNRCNQPSTASISPGIELTVPPHFNIFHSTPPQRKKTWCPTLIVRNLLHISEEKTLLSRFPPFCPSSIPAGCGQKHPDLGCLGVVVSLHRGACAQLTRGHCGHARGLCGA